MNRLKHVLVILIILAIITVVFNFSSKVYAVEYSNEEIESIDFESENFHQYMENTDGRWAKDYNDQDFFNYTVYGFQLGDRLTINLVGGTSKTYVFDNNSDHYGFFDGDEKLEGNYSIDSEQYQNHWYVGGENNYVIINYQGKTTTHNFTMIVNPVESISFEPVLPYKYVENAEGEYEEEDGDRYFVYDIGYFKRGDELTVEYTDPEKGTVTYVYEINGWGFCDAQGNQLEGSVTKSHNQRDNHWEINKENYFSVRYMGREVQVPVKIIKDPIKEILYEPIEAYEFVESTHGHEEDGYYFYDVTGQEGDVLTVRYTEEAGGGEKQFTFSHDENYSTRFISADGEIIGYDKVRYMNDQAINHWTTSTTNYETIWYMGHEVQLPVVIKENPVTSISIIKKEPIVYYEYVQGNNTTEKIWDEQLEQYVKVQYFRYWNDPFKDGDILVVNNVEYEYKWISDYETGFYDYVFCNQSGDKITLDQIQISDEQATNHWTKNGDNKITVTYMGRTAYVNVTIVENPVHTIEYITNYNHEVVYGIDGENISVSRWNNETGEYENVDIYYYNYYNIFHIGDKLIINGTTEYEYKYVYDEEKGYGDYVFVNQAGEIIESYDVDTDTKQEEVPWTIGGQNYITIKYMGRETQIPVTVKENTVTAIEYHCANGGMKLIQNVDGELIPAGDGVTEEYFCYWPEYYMPGDELVVTDDTGTKTYIYTRGSSTKEEGFYTADNSSYISPGKVMFDDDQNVNHWILGTNNTATVTYMNHTANISIEIIEDYIESIEFEPVEPYQFIENKDGQTITVTDIEGNFIEEKYVYWNYGFRDGDKLTIHKKDQTSETYTCRKSEEYDSNGFYLGDKIVIYLYMGMMTNGIHMDDDQYEREAWTVGGDNFLYVRYKGKEAKVPVTILPECEHETELKNVKAATCKEEGYTGDEICTKCGKIVKKGTKIAKLSHTAGIPTETVSTTKATLSKNGEIAKTTITKCTACGEVISNNTTKTPIYYPKTITLSKSVFKYNKKEQKPTVKIVGSDGKVIANTNYTITYSNAKSKGVGRYSVTITFKGNYTGSKTFTYDIIPVGTTISKLKAASKKITISWKKQATETSGYEVQYSTNKNFKSGNKTVNVKKNKTTSSTVSKLKGKKKYFVRIRTYKTVKVNGKSIKIYSDWSKAKNTTTKK